MKPSDRILLTALAIGAAAAGALWWFWQDLTWWLYAGTWLAVSAGSYNGLSRDVMTRKIVDKDT